MADGMVEKPIPDGYHSVTPYLIVSDGDAALEFYKAAFGAVERMRIDGPGGKLGHAEMMIGDSCVMLASEFPDFGMAAPKEGEPPSAFVMVYTENVDETFERAVAEGATVVRPLADQFYGDRCGTVRDPFGHHWTLSTHVEDVPPDELARRSAEWASGSGQDA